MRVLHIGKFFPPQPGGIERFVAELAAAQQAQGLTPSVLVHDPTVDGFRDDPFPLRRVRSYRDVLFVPISPGWPRAFATLCREQRPDLLHVHVPNASAFWLLASPAARRLPWVLHWHADVPEDARHRGLRLAYPAYRLLEHRLLRRAAAIIATSNPYLEASRALRAHRERCHVVPLGMAAAPEPAAVPAWPGNGLRLLAVGRLSYYKGFSVLLDALREVDDVSLLLIGSGDLAGTLQAQIQRLGLADRVRLAGGTDDATLEAAYRACDLFCLPSIDRAEAFGLVLLEAMRAGRPIIASAIPGSGVGAVVAPECGRLVPPGNPVALAAALRELAADRQLRERMGAAGRARFAREFGIAPVAEKISSLYRSVLAARPPAG